MVSRRHPGADALAMLSQKRNGPDASLAFGATLIRTVRSRADQLGARPCRATAARLLERSQQQDDQRKAKDNDERHLRAAIRFRLRLRIERDVGASRVVTGMAA